MTVESYNPKTDRLEELSQEEYDFEKNILTTQSMKLALIKRISALPDDKNTRSIVLKLIDIYDGR